MHKGQEGVNIKMCYEFRNDGCKRDNMSHTHLLTGLFLEKYSLKSLQKSFQKSFLKIYVIVSRFM
jgi:hypothetical protein